MGPLYRLQDNYTSGKSAAKATQPKLGPGGAGDSEHRKVMIGAKTRRAIHHYLDARSGVSPHTPLWATAQDHRLTYAGLRQIVRRHAEKADIPEPGLHAFRRTFALSCLRNGMDVFSLQRLMGHADLTILRRYLAETEEDLRAAHEKAGPVDKLL